MKADTSSYQSLQLVTIRIAGLTLFQERNCEQLAIFEAGDADSILLSSVTHTFSFYLSSIPSLVAGVSIRLGEVDESLDLDATDLSTRRSTEGPRDVGELGE